MQLCWDDIIQDMLTTGYITNVWTENERSLCNECKKSEGNLVAFGNAVKMKTYPVILNDTIGYNVWVTL